MRTRQRNLATSISVLAAALALLAVPAIATAGPIKDLLNGLGLGGNGGNGGQSQGSDAPAPAPEPASPQPAAGVPGQDAGYQPPLHGSNPHGQGTVGVVDLDPSDGAPLSGDPSGAESGEEIVIGRARGEQNADGSYSGSVTILGLFGLLGANLLGVETSEGETATGPLGPLQDALDQVCTTTGNAVCLSVLAVNSSTDGSGSTNSFQLLGGSVGTESLPAPLNGVVGLSTGISSSHGNISEDGNCQTAQGGSSVANAEIGVGVIGALSADALQSSTTSQACNDGSSSQTNESSVVDLAGTGIPVPAEGCADGTPDSEFLLSLLLADIGTVCNADDTNGAGELIVQAGVPYGVREGLSAFAVLLGTPLLKATTAASESRAVAPGAGPTDPGPGPEDPGPDGDDPTPRGEADQPEDTVTEADVPSASTVTPTDGGRLPFTGANLAVLLLLGATLIGAGMLARMARTRVL